jgi:dethiobiotin synthetase
MSKNFFITGTDTGVGKTHVTALLLAELRRRGIRAAAMKPIACGRDGRHDAEIFAALMNGEQPLDVINPVYLRSPLAPMVAASVEKKQINLAVVRKCFRILASEYSVVLVEGAGGLLVPIKRNYFVADLARSLRLPVVIVGRLGLGTINHTLLTCRQARAMGLSVAGVVLNDTTGRVGLAEKTNRRVVPELCAAPFLGVFPHGKTGGRAVVKEVCSALLQSGK